MLVEVLSCEIDGQVLEGMQFRVLVKVPLCEIDGGLLGGTQLRVPLWRYRFARQGACSLECWLRCCFARLTAGC